MDRGCNVGVGVGEGVAVGVSVGVTVGVEVGADGVGVAFAHPTTTIRISNGKSKFIFDFTRLSTAEQIIPLIKYNTYYSTVWVHVKINAIQRGTIARTRQVV